MITLSQAPQKVGLLDAKGLKMVVCVLTDKLLGGGRFWENEPKVKPFSYAATCSTSPFCSVKEQNEVK